MSTRFAAVSIGGAAWAAALNCSAVVVLSVGILAPVLLWILEALEERRTR
jgi:hypothetical protein